MKPIGNFKPANPFFLAPMEAVNCASFRVLCKKRGASLVYTDMIDADDFMKYVHDHGEQAAVARFVNPQKDESPLAIQLGGPYFETLKETIRILEPYATTIDYNVGCPLSPMLAKKGGVYLMKHPDQLEKLMTQMRGVITKPFTVKIRAGWDEDSKNALEVAKMLERIGVDGVAVHARTRKQRYQERADWPLVRSVAEALSIPVILSGDVTNTYMAYMGFAHTKCDYIMCARGAKANPSLFTQLRAYWKNPVMPEKPEGLYVKDTQSARDDFEEFLHLYKKREIRNNFSEIKDHALWTATGCLNARVIRQHILQARSENELRSIFSSIRFGAVSNDLRTSKKKSYGDKNSARTFSSRLNRKEQSRKSSWMGIDAPEKKPLKFNSVRGRSGSQEDRARTRGSSKTFTQINSRTSFDRERDSRQSHAFSRARPTQSRHKNMRDTDRTFANRDRSSQGRASQGSSPHFRGKRSVFTNNADVKNTAGSFSKNLRRSVDTSHHSYNGSDKASQNGGREAFRNKRTKGSSHKSFKGRSFRNNRS